MMFAKGGYDRKDTIDDIQDFVKNIVNDDNNRDIEVKGDKAKFISEQVNNKFWALPAWKDDERVAQRSEEEDLLDIEYYDESKTSNSIRSVGQQIKSKKDLHCTLDLASKKSIFDCWGNFPKRKDSYSSAFMDLLNSEIIENSSKSSLREGGISHSGINLDLFDKSENSDVSWNLLESKVAERRARIASALISERNQDWTCHEQPCIWWNLYDDDSHEKSKEVLSNINDFLKAKNKKKTTLVPRQQHEMDKSYDQGQRLNSDIGSSVTNKISPEKTSEGSSIFNLSHSQASRPLRKFSKNTPSECLNDQYERANAAENSNSTFRDFEGLVGSSATSNRQFEFGRNTDRGQESSHGLNASNVSKEFSNMFNFGSGRTYDLCEQEKNYNSAKSEAETFPASTSMHLKLKKLLL